MSFKNFFSRIDYGQLFLIFLLFGVSLVAIYSAQQGIVYEDRNFLLMQTVFYASGLVIAFVVMQFDHKQLMKVVWYLYGIGVGLSAFILLAPTTQLTAPIKGAKRWIHIPYVTSIQPSEFMKIFLIIALACVVHQHHKRYELKSSKTDLILFGKLVFFTFLPLVFIIKEDLGTSIILLAIMGSIMLVSGISWRWLLPVFFAAVMIVAGLLYLVFEKPHILEDYLGVKTFRLERLYAWHDPYSSPGEHSFQLIKSFTAIGSGEVTGKGFKQREVALPEAHSDFIFSIVGEEYGFLGGSLVIILFFILIFIWIRIALETKLDFNSYICVGIIGLFTFQVFQNIGMTIGLMPITGIPLPFLSYGGSSLWSSMMALGLIFSIRYHHKVYMFGSEDN